MGTFTQSIVKNAVAIISLCLAMSSLGYNTWRNERSERNRSKRVAAFEVLKNLGELQVVVNDAYYNKEAKPMPLAGWARVSVIADLSELLPPPAHTAAQRVLQAWRDNVASVSTQETAVASVTREIDAYREMVLRILMELN